MTEEKTVSILPALPGWSVAILIEDPASLVYRPIIAWDIERTEKDYPRDGKHREYDTHIGHHVEPITADGNLRYFGNRWGVRMPDGRIEFESTLFDDEADLLKEVEEERAAALLKHQI